jgi:glycosyltransferase involved in cell wall biosynthesis
MSQTFGISAIIPTHNRSTILRRTLESLTMVEVPSGCEFEVIVIGNRCTDDTRKAVEEIQQQYCLNIHYLEETQLGANFARNTGFRQAAYDIIALLDDDLWVSSSWYTAIMSVYDSTDAAIVGGPAELWWEAVQRPDWFSNDMEWILSGVNLGLDVKEVPGGMGLIGCNLTARREVFAKVGLFHTGIDRRGGSLMGGFESDFMQKATLAGFRCYYSPTAHVKHWVAPHRIEDKYILGICKGYGEVRIYIKPTFRAHQALRVIFGHAALIIKHRILQLFSRERSAKMRHRIAQAIGHGGIRGGLNRCFFRAYPKTPARLNVM